MKTILPTLVLLITLGSAHSQGFGQPGSVTQPPEYLEADPADGGQTSNASAAGLLSEEADHDLAAAAAAYRQTIQNFDRQREGAANAIFRLGEVYRKLGRLEEAKVQYARILREFPDLARLTEISHALLLGSKTQTAGVGAGTLGVGGGSMDGGGGSTGIGAGSMGGAGGGFTSGGSGSIAGGSGYGGGSGIGTGTAMPAAGGTTSGAGAADPTYHRLMMQRYGLMPGGGSPRYGGAAGQGTARSKSERINCVNNLKQLGLAVRIFATDNQGVYPPNVAALSNEIVVTKVLVCPSDIERQPAASWSEFDPAVHMTYRYTGATKSEEQPGEVIFECPIHGNVGLADGSVQQRQTPQAGGLPQMNEAMKRRYGLMPSPQTQPSQEIPENPDQPGQPPNTAMTMPPDGTFQPEIGTRQPTLIPIMIERDGSLQLDGDHLELEQLTDKLNQLPDDVRSIATIHIKSDKEADFNRIFAVFEACQKAGIGKFSLKVGPERDPATESSPRETRSAGE